jgi:hypothetical protein
MAILLTSIACILLIAGAILYIWNTKRNGVTPNPAQFLIRTGVAVINSIVYFHAAEMNFRKTSITFSSIFCMISISIYCWVNGKFAAIRKIDIVCISSAVIVTLFWLLTNDKTLATWILQAVILLGIFPAVQGICTGVLKELPLTWFLGVAAYSLIIFVLYIENSSFDLYVHPVIGGIIGNGALFLASYRSKRRLKK